jgi:hypothetical protein
LVVDDKCDGAIEGDMSGKLAPGASRTFTCTRVIRDNDPDPLPNEVTVTGHDDSGKPVDGKSNASVDIVDGTIEVDKKGPDFAYHGDTVTFTYDVTNGGTEPITNVVVTDDKCSPVSADPVSRTGDDGDAALEPGEVWTYECKLTLGAHAGGEENPLVNTATAKGIVLRKQVSATDKHSTKILHTAVGIDKTGPATANAGAILNYTLTVTNPGDVPFAAQEVVVTDPKCDAPPLLTGKSAGGGAADASPDTLDPGDAWVYTCSYQTGETEASVLNVAFVTAKDLNGRPASDDDDQPTTLSQVEVLPDNVVSGRSRLRGPSGCVSKPFRAVVTGRQMQQVTFLLNGKRIKTVRVKRGAQPESTQRVTYRFKPSGLSRGVQRVTARIKYVAAAETPQRTLRFAFQRCARVLPKFTG